MIPAIFTSLQLLWAFLWAKKHFAIRKLRKYAHGRAKVDTNLRYKRLTPFLFTSQNAICILSFWSHSPGLLPLHDSDTWRAIGFVILYGAMALYFWSLRHLGNNYSPCYDSHFPMGLVESGPYQYIRHPMYLAKVFVGLGTVIVSGSWWFVPLAMYLFGATFRSMRKEESQLTGAAGFALYKTRTKMLVPFII